jgi:hypothetical protein
VLYYPIRTIIKSPFWVIVNQFFYWSSKPAIYLTKFNLDDYSVAYGFVWIFILKRKNLLQELIMVQFTRCLDSVVITWLILLKYLLMKFFMRQTLVRSLKCLQTNIFSIIVFCFVFMHRSLTAHCPCCQKISMLEIANSHLRPF